MAGRPPRRGRWEGRRRLRRSRRDAPDAAPGPGDRPWFHPSELPADPADAAPRPSRSPRSVTVPIVAGLAGAVATLGVTALVSGAGGDGSGRSATSTSLAVPVAVSVPPGAGGDVAAMGPELAPAVVGVTVWSGAAARYGSGLAYRPDGAVVTSAALVTGGETIEVTIAGGETATARVLGLDPETDVAVLDSGDLSLPALAFGAATTRVEVGQPCLLVAGAGGTDSAWVARSLVAGIGRVVPSGGHWMVDMVEVDTAVAGEAGGGAVFDGQGGLIGMLTTAARDRGTGTLVVPADTARRAADQILAHGEVRHPWLGVATADVQRPVAGAAVKDVAPGSPAGQAGIATGDVIVSLAGEPVGGMTDLLRAVRRHDPGSAVTIRLMRGGERLEVTATLTTRPA